VGMHKKLDDTLSFSVIFGVIYRTQDRDSVSSGYPNIEKRVENTMRSRVCLTKFKVFV